MGAKREHHHEKKREKADHQLEQKMHDKELPKTNAVTVSTSPAASAAVEKTKSDLRWPHGFAAACQGQVQHQLQCCIQLYVHTASACC